MYLVFIAMMALNVSSEVLDGFELVEGSLRTSIDNTSTRNEIVTEELKAYYQTNPEKVREWYEKGTKVKEASDSLYNYVQDLKVRIAQIADGKDADVNNIDHKDDLEAASRVMLSPVSGEGKKLRQSIEKYRTLMGEMVRLGQDAHHRSQPVDNAASQGRYQYSHLGRGFVREYAGGGGCYLADEIAKRYPLCRR